MRLAIASFFLINSLFCSSFDDSIFDDDLSYFEQDENIDDLSDEAITPPQDKPQAPSPITKPQTTPIPVLTQQNVNPSPAKIEQTKSSHFYSNSFDKDHLVNLGISYLYWTVSEPGLHTAITKDKQINVDETPINLNTGTGGQIPNFLYYFAFGDIKKNSFSFSSGVRADASFQFKHSPWNLFSEYSYYQTSTDKLLQRPNTDYGYIRGLNVFQYNNVIVETANLTSFFNYQNAKFLIGFSFKPLKELLINFRFGPQSTWIRQKLNANFNPYNAPQPPVPGIASCFNTFDNKAWGIGLLANLGVEGHLGKGFSLGFEAGISGMSGQTQYHHFVISDNVADKSYQPFFDIRQKPTYQFMGQGSLKGTLAYSYSFSSMCVRLETAYEFNALINMLDLYRMGDSTGYLYNTTFTNYQNTPIYLQGVNVKFSIGF
jgi:Legionella pneumophila major outer membrane protein precursor